MAARDHAQGSGVTVGGVEVKAKRDQPSQRFRIQLGVRNAVSDPMLPHRGAGDRDDAVLVTRYRPVGACMLVEEGRIERNSAISKHSSGELVDSASCEQSAEIRDFSQEAPCREGAAGPVMNRARDDGGRG